MAKCYEGVGGLGVSVEVHCEALFPRQSSSAEFLGRVPRQSSLAEVLMLKCVFEVRGWRCVF